MCRFGLEIATILRSPERIRTNRRDDMLRRFALATVLAAGLPVSGTASPVGADGLSGGLHIAIAGTVGAGLTTWTFSGTSTTVGAVRIDDNDNAVGLGWIVGAAFYAGTDLNIDFLSSTATLTDGSTVFAIEGVGAQDTNPTTVFGIAIEDGTSVANYTFADSTALTFAGSATAPVDISEFAPGGLVASGWDNRGQLPNAELDVSVQAEPSVIPVPAALPLLLGGIALLFALGRRRG
jgi:hypothetical protein